MQSIPSINACYFEVLRSRREAEQAAWEAYRSVLRRTYLARSVYVMIDDLPSEMYFPETTPVRVVETPEGDVLNWVLGFLESRWQVEPVDWQLISRARSFVWVHARSYAVGPSRHGPVPPAPFSFRGLFNATAYFPRLQSPSGPTLFIRGDRASSFNARPED